jgi:nucleotide-binding universal stress UspA family protein
VNDILAYCADARVWSPGVRYAAELAANLGALLTGLHVSPPMPAREPQDIPPSLMAEFVAYAQEEVRTAMLAGPRFDAWAREFGVRSTQWQVALGDPADVLGLAGNWNDVIVIERRLGDREDTTSLICEVLLSGFSCICVPENAYAIGRIERIVVAFDGSPASIRALHRATPLLRHATHVILLHGSWRDADGEPATYRPAFDPIQHLRGHDIGAQVEEIAESGARADESILETASRNRADLLVIGVGGKRQRGDCHLDSVAGRLLRCASLPLFMTQ